MIKKGLKIKDNIILYLYAISAIIILYAPYQIDSTLGNNSLRIVLRSFLYLIALSGLLFGISKKIKNSSINIRIIFYLLSFVVYFLLTTFHSYDGKISITGVLTLTLAIGFCFFEDKNKQETFEIFKKIWFVICIIAIICFVSYSFGLFLPYKIKAYYSLVSGDLYIDYTLSFLYKSGSIVRLCGICNEPGFFGTITALILCTEKVRLNNRRNIIMLIAGFLTFSLAFMLIIMIYLLLRSWKDKKVFIVIMLIMIIYFLVIPNIEFKNANINRLLDRLTISETGFKGDNRSNDKLDMIYEQTIKENPIFGKGVNYVSSLKIHGVSSYKSFIVDFGIVGSLLIWGFLLLSVIYKNNSSINNIAFVIVFFISIYQRPNIFVLPYQIVLLGGMQYINYLNKGQKDGNS